MQNNQDSNIRKVIKDCSASQISNFILALEKSSDYERKSYQGITDNCHLERFNYVVKEDKLSMVYDTKANSLSLTSTNNAVDCTEKLFCAINGAEFVSNVIASGTPKNTSTNNSSSSDNSKNGSVRLKQDTEGEGKKSNLPKHLKSNAKKGGAVRLKAEVGSDIVDRAENKKSVPQKDNRRVEVNKAVESKNVVELNSNNTVANGENKKAVSQKDNKRIEPKKADKDKFVKSSGVKMLAYKNGFSDKNFSNEKFKEVFASLYARANTSIVKSQTQLACEGEELNIYEVTSGKDKAIIRYMPNKNALALQGKASDIYLHIQMLVAFGVDYTTRLVGNKKTNDSPTNSSGKDNSIVKDNKQPKPKKGTNNSGFDGVKGGVKTVNNTNSVSGSVSVASSKTDTKPAKDYCAKAIADKTTADKKAKEKPVKESAEEKRLRKLMPNAYDYLHKQSIQYFVSGYTDLTNKKAVLTDYSVLLQSPFKGLERLIYGLQIAEGINVKMIGQGFEKTDEGNYCLKSGYQKRVDSIVYNEVMSSLYTVYCEERNYYLHSDNSPDSQARIIGDKKLTLSKFLQIVAVMEYNCKKLKEIGFTIDTNE